MEEVRENVAEAIQLILEANREAFEKQLPPGSKGCEAIAHPVAPDVTS